LVVPLAHDQFDNGMRVQALGVGYTLPASCLTTKKMASAIEKLLSSANIHEQCRLIAANFAGTDNEDALCKTIARA